MPGRKYQSGGYRYGFNGQEKERDLNENITTALFWEYDSRIARRWNIDPKLNPWQGGYDCLGNNPIVYSDVNGDVFDNATGSDKRADRIQSQLESRRRKVQGWIDDNNEKIEKARENIRKLNEKVGKKGYTEEDARKDTEKINGDIAKLNTENTDYNTKTQLLTESITDIQNMRTDAEVYIFESIVGEEGGSYRRAADRAIIMKVTSDENAVHELTHGMQIHNGIIRGTGENTMQHTDLYGEELQAYRRQYALDPASVKRQAPSYPRDARSLNDLTQNWLLGINLNGNFLYLNIFMQRNVPEAEAKQILDGL